MGIKEYVQMLMIKGSFYLNLDSEETVCFQTESDSLDSNSLDIWKEDKEIVFLNIETSENTELSMDYDALEAFFKENGVPYSPEAYVMIGDEVTYDASIERFPIDSDENPSVFFQDSLDKPVPPHDLEDEDDVRNSDLYSIVGNW